MQRNNEYVFQSLLKKYKQEANGRHRSPEQQIPCIILYQFLNIFLIYFCVKIWTPLGAHNLYNLQSILFEDACKVILQIVAS